MGLLSSGTRFDFSQKDAFFLFHLPHIFPSFSDSSPSLPLFKYHHDDKGRNKGGDKKMNTRHLLYL